MYIVHLAYKQSMAACITSNLFWMLHQCDCRNLHRQRARASCLPEVDKVGVEQDVIGRAERVVGAEEHGRRLQRGQRLDDARVRLQ